MSVITVSHGKDGSLLPFGPEGDLEISGGKLGNGRMLSIEHTADRCAVQYAVAIWNFDSATTF